MNLPTGNVELGTRIRSLRQDQGKKLAAVARQAAVSLQYLSEVERGLKSPSLQVLSRIAGALGVTAVELLSGVAPYDGPGAGRSVARDQP